MWIATREQSQDIDRRATDDFGIPARDLMEHAGLAIAQVAEKFLNKTSSIAIFCGPGNNGGDGFVVARLLHERGHKIACFVPTEESALHEECHFQMMQAKAAGVTPQLNPNLDNLSQFDLIIDALLGIGAQGQIRSPIKESIQAINKSGVPVLAVDIPSGIDTNTGQDLGESIWASQTITIGLPKLFLFQGAGLEHAGNWAVDPINFPPELLTQARSAQLLNQAQVASLLPKRFRGSHKGSNGKLLIVAGSHEMRGAAVLATKAALATGIGLITVAAIESVCESVINHCPEATLQILPEINGVIAPQSADLILDRQSEFNASLFGPGTTHRDPVKEFFARLWPRWEVPSLIDADALNAISNGLDLPAAPCVLTPHPGEMARLLNQHTTEVQANRFSAVQNAVSKYKNTILLKGPYSIVGNPFEPMSVNSTGNPGMATAGMGDVLGGIIATLLAQELSPYQAACAGMVLHGLSGDLCAQELGEIGYTASNVAGNIPRARAKLTAS